MSDLNTRIKEIDTSYRIYEEGNSQEALKQISKHLNSAVRNNDKRLLCLCLALKALYSYSTEPFNKIMVGLENADFLADTINCKPVKDIIN